MKGEKDALLMLAHRKGVNEKRIPNGPGFTVTLGCAMGNRSTSVCSVLVKEKKNQKPHEKKETVDNEGPYRNITVIHEAIIYIKVTINYLAP